MMDKFSTTKRAKLRAKELATSSITVAGIQNSLIRIEYPYNIDLTVEFIRKQDELIQATYHRFHKRLPQLIIQLDGISELSPSCRPYILSTSHQKLYAATAYVLSKGNMSVLERHYLEHLLANQLQNKRLAEQNYYPVGIFGEYQSAEIWLASHPGSHHRH